MPLEAILGEFAISCPCCRFPWLLAPLSASPVSFDAIYTALLYPLEQ